MKNFAIFVNPAFAEKPAISGLLKDLATEYRINFYGIREQRDLLPEEISFLDPDSPARPEIDCVLVFGGDGTILKAKDLALSFGAPVLGINLGWLGFLSETTLGELKTSIRDLLNHKYRLLPRMLINCQLRRNKEIIFKGLALNDAVIHKADTPRLIHVRIFTGGRFVFDTRCDGVVASTPTGSTAYSLAAGAAGHRDQPAQSASAHDPSDGLFHPGYHSDAGPRTGGACHLAAGRRQLQPAGGK